MGTRRLKLRLMREGAPRRSFLAPILRIVIPYLILGAAWILYSDRLLLPLIDNPSALLAFSTIKGWLYVLITGILLSVLIGRELRRQLSLERQLRKELDEKGVLLFELNHRVKNNLQVIASLLSLEGSRIEDGLARELVASMSGRVRAMALVHTQFSESEGSDRIELGSYLRALWPELVEVFRAKGAEASFTSEEIYASSDLALPFGLFVTEALALALRSGLSAGQACVVAMSLRRLSSGLIEFCVKLQGSAASYGGLGGELMEILAQQFHGKLEHRLSGGPWLRITFPLSEARLYA
jgi:two-component sensor histidine kinase